MILKGIGYVDEGLQIEERQNVAFASILARKNQDGETIGELIGGSLREGPLTTILGDTVYIGTGPGSWLATSSTKATDFADNLATKLAGRASVSDQSGAYCVTRITGDRARHLLQRGVAINLHPDVFTTGCAATTVIAHIAVVIWQIDISPTYDIATFRTYSPDFRHWLAHSWRSF